MTDPELQHVRSNPADPPTAALPPRGHPRLPCRVCGYHSPADDDCPHCGHAPLEASLRTGHSAPAELTAGATALVRGAVYLLGDRRSMLTMCVPLALTLFAFAGLTAWALSWVEQAVATVAPEDWEVDESVPAWLAWLLEWPVRAGLVAFTTKLGALLATVLLAALAFWFAFSIVFEALAGPFLDEIQGRFEARWFGADPRSRLERPTGAEPRRMARRSWLALAGGLLAAAFVSALGLGSLGVWPALAAAVAPVVALSTIDRPFGRWLFWVARIELGALRASLLGLTLTGAMLLLALPLLWIPVLGTYLYGAAAGFATSLALLDIPFSRRGLGAGERLAFVRQHPLATTLYGASSGLLFGIPFIGPLLVVPAASVGGLWLFCRLDKSGLRSRAQARGPRTSDRDAGRDDAGRDPGPRGD
ncbi:MAG: hypothetical protein ACYTFV_02480 [Planctomycetota bacterium]|jgi:uncharacterized protein involved in cysteine biosynthesis